MESRHFKHLVNIVSHNSTTTLLKLLSRLTQLCLCLIVIVTVHVTVCIRDPSGNTGPLSVDRYEEAVRALKERDAQLEARRRTHRERLQTAEKNSARLQGEVQALAAQLRGVQEELQESTQRREDTIQR